MQLQVVSIVFILGVIGFAEMVNGVCFVRNTNTPKVYRYQCFRTNNYLADIEAAPIDIPEVRFTSGKMPILRNRSFARLSSGLKGLEIYSSKIGEIEDNAFEGLFELNSLEIVSCNLHIVKSAWVKGLAKLKYISFRDNKIQRIESRFFSIVPPLQRLDISGNELSCIPVAALVTFKTKQFFVRDNPFTLVCLASLLEWLKDKNIWREFDGQTSLSVPLEPMIDMCVDKLPNSALEEPALEKCIEETMASFLPPWENYTSHEVCQFLKGKPGFPLLNCTYAWLQDE